MADLDPKTATLREVAELYAKKSGRGKAFIGPTLQYFKDIADEPGSAMRLFEKDTEGNTLLSKTFKESEDTSTVKSAMQNLRQVGLTLKSSVGPDTPEYKLLPDEKPNTDLNNRIFGRAEPAKAVSEVAINPDKKKMSQLFAGVAAYLDDEEMRPVAQAIIFNLNTGLRPNAVAGLKISSYKPDTGAIYISAETKGAKGRAVNIPLNPIADAILQDRLRRGVKGTFFTKSNGNPVTSTDMTNLLKTIKIPDIAYDAATGKFFDTLAPEKFSGKKGSALLRNVHATIGHSIGISQERLAYLQGRSLKAASTGSVGEIATYQTAFPGAVGDFDREQAGKFATYWSEAAQEAGFDIKSKVPILETRITSQTSGFEGYFDLPVQEQVSPSERPITSKDPINNNAGSFNLEEDLKSRGLDLNTLLKKPEAGEIPTRKGKGIGPAIVVGGGVGLTAAGLATETEAAVRDIAIETAVETGGKAMRFGPTPVGITAGAVTGILEPSPATDVTEMQAEEQKQLELAREAGDIAAEKELMAREPIRAVRGPYDVERYPSAEEMTFGFIQEQEAMRKREEAAAAAAKPTGFLAP